MTTLAEIADSILTTDFDDQEARNKAADDARRDAKSLGYFNRMADDIDQYNADLEDLYTGIDPDPMLIDKPLELRVEVKDIEELPNVILFSERIDRYPELKEYALEQMMAEPPLGIYRNNFMRRMSHMLDCERAPKGA